MNVKQLKEKLNNLPEEMEVMIPRVDEEAMYTLLESVEVKSIRFHECELPDEICECEVVAHENCVILDEL